MYLFQDVSQDSYSKSRTLTVFAMLIKLLAIFVRYFKSKHLQPQSEISPDIFLKKLTTTKNKLKRDFFVLNRKIANLQHIERIIYV